MMPTETPCCGHLTDCQLVHETQKAISRSNASGPSDELFATPPTTSRTNPACHEKDLPEQCLRAPFVRFGSIEVREYAMELGDNPSCSAGPALSIGWDYITTLRGPLTCYEESREPRRSRHHLYLPCNVRERRLRKEGFSYEEICKAAQQTRKDRMKRAATANSKKYEKYEESIEKARKKFLQLLKVRQKDEVLIEKLWKNPVASHKARAA